MIQTIQNKPMLGTGIYTVPDIGLILKEPNSRIRWYIEEVWDNRFGKKLFNERYSWDINNHKAVNFLVLIEFKVVFILKKMGISTQKILKARNVLAEELSLPYPFATTNLLANSDSIWYRFQDLIINADKTKQINFKSCVEQYCENIDFGSNQVAERFWPDGKTSSVVVDPHHQFGSPIIDGTNITAATIYSMIKAGDSISTLSNLYEVSEKKILDTVNFYKHAA